MLKSIDGGLRAVPFPVEDPERIPARRYFDQGFYDLEREHLWPHVWQNACRLEQIPEVGDWIEYANLGHSVLVTRTAQGVKAYHNACRHRGVPIAGGSGQAHGNCARTGFVCPFHGWRWNMDGENTMVYGKHLFSERQMDEQDLRLRECRVELFGGCAWINLDDEAPGLRESLGPVTERLEAHGIDHLRAEWHFATVLPANWKTAMEAFMEGYHVMQTHPQLHHTLQDIYHDAYSPERTTPGATEANLRKGAIEGVATRTAIAAQLEHLQLLSSGMAGMCHQKEVDIARELRDVDLPDNPNEAVPLWFAMVQGRISQQLRARGEPVPDLNAVAVSHPIRPVEFLFPHYFLLPMFSSMSAYRIRPLGPESCYFELWSLTMFPKGQEPEPVMEPTVLPYDSPEFPQIPRQDYSNIPIQQKALHAKGFEFMRLARGIEGLISNYQRLIDGYLAGMPQARLASANQVLGGNFDGPIADIGF
ncbi:aromatic ring-hydroxylating oxygenase subunit alpha [Novosphingobium album (ex Liu et al. 2023)]|uniref:Aromatic ring-hydroxylating dioxygenase subunit alpha n=1 Tax=Novosphingobium album (ex Liu et al. 2023) TaxID=3031130 RepID=A0ABT5WUJ9_9SPHN|nr:aromatic ring-hydroxylating dioxygenase subunit alpha [Novosphingobium album (ex Liu et al. 2023)]MDE8653554.1 aromatic ring-hydroxylating dioxygenase subunit alpha [Novosphingobium album (ex Liu et al. 2023)]